MTEKKIRPNTSEEQRAVGNWVSQHVLQNCSMLMAHLQQNPGEYEDEILDASRTRTLKEDQYKVTNYGDNIEVHSLDDDGDEDKLVADLAQADICWMEAEIDLANSQELVEWLIANDKLEEPDENWEVLTGEDQEPDEDCPVHFSVHLQLAGDHRQAYGHCVIHKNGEPVLELSSAELAMLQESTDPDDPQEVVNWLIARGTLPQGSTGIDTDDDPEWEEGEAYEHYIVDSVWARHFTCHEIFSLTIWPRGCTGQAILLDGDVVVKFRELHPELYEDPEAALAAYT